MERSDTQVLIDAIADGIPNTALKVRTALNALANGGYTGDVKEIDVSNAYLTANFDATGLGKNERLGWAICNGNNGTRNRSGRVAMQYDISNYPTLGAVGGSKDAVVVAHSHSTRWNMNTGSGPDIGSTLVATAHGSGAGIVTDSSGETGVNKNLQPYMITLMIMKL